ncbi:MAG: hypothetical protein OEZ68_20135, partial [Gammaproteobacteria bacterium]|nr:hypothetical protein [Gammaproteobacteria bacterium]
LVVRGQDEYLKTLGIDTNLIRTYNSRGKFVDDNGDNWQLSVHKRLININTGSSVTLRRGDGAESVFTYANGRYTSTDGTGAHEYFTYSSGIWTWNDGSGEVQETYNSSGYLIGTKDRDGTTTSYSYTGSLLTRITDSSGQTVNLRYNANRLERIETLSAGKLETRVHYGYDSQNRLVQVIADLTPTDNNISAGDSNADGIYETVNGQTYVTTYTYDGTSKRIASVTQGDATRISFGYYTNGKLQSYTDGNGKTTQFAYGTSITDVTDPLGQITRYTRDSLGRMTRKEQLGTGIVTQYQYDSANNLTRIIDANNNSTSYQYDTQGNLKLSQDAEGNTVSYTYNAQNLLLTQTAYTNVDPNLGNSINEATDPKTSRYVYDGEGHLRFLLSAEGKVTEHQYNTNGTVKTTRIFTDHKYPVSGLSITAVPSLSQMQTWAADLAKQAKTQRSDFAYDFRGNLSSSTTYTDINPTTGAGQSAGSQTTQFVYDPHGNLLQTIDPRGVATPVVGDYQSDYQYDGLSRLLKTTEAQSGAEITNPQETPNITSVVYDDQNNRVHSVAANGLKTTNYYNDAGQLIRTDSTPLWEQDFSVGASGLVGSGLTNPNAMEVRDGRLVTKTFDNPTGTWPNLRGKIYQFSEGVDYRMEVTTGATSAGRYLLAGVDNSKSGAAYRRHYAYFAGGNVYAHIRRADLVYQNIHLGAIQNNVTYIVEMETGNDGTTLYVYEKGKDRASGWVNHQTLNDYGTVNSRLFTYGGPGRAASEMYIDNMSERQTLSSTQYVYDTEGKLRITQDSFGERQHLLYDTADRPVAAIDANGTLIETVYDKADNAVKTIAYANALSQATLASLTNTDGSPGNITLDQIRPAATTSGAADKLLDRVTRNIYDKANRLVMSFQADKYVSTAQGLKEEGYVSQNFYDGRGQIVKTMAYAKPVQILHSATSVLPDDIDALLSSDPDDRIHRNYYDKDGQLIASLNSEGYLAEFKYNQAGQLFETYQHARQYTGSLITDPSLASVITAVGTHADDQHQYTLYNARGQQVGSVDAEGYLTEYLYDAVGNLETEHAYARKANAVTASSTLANVRPSATPVYDANNRIISDRITRYTYNARNQLAESTSPEGVKTAYQYDRVGNLIQATRSLGGANQNLARTRVSQYDLQGNLIRTLTAQGKAALDALVSPTQAQIDALWAEYGESYGYDAEGRRTSTTDQWGNTSFFYYNEDGQLRYSVNALGEVKETLYNNYGEITETIAYVNRLSATALSRVIASAGGLLNSLIQAYIKPASHAADQRSKQTYDLRGQVKVALDGNNYRNEFQYNAFGEVHTQKQQFKDPTSNLNIALTNANSVQTTHKYDRRGLLTDSYRDSASGGFNLHNSTRYDAFGRVDTSTNAKNQLVDFTYDKLGRVTQIVEPGNVTRSTTYDAFSRVLTQTDALQNVTKYSYNDTEKSFSIITPEGIETKTIQNAHGETYQIIQNVGGKNLTTQYDYDLNGNLTQVTEAKGTPDQVISQTSNYDNGSEHNRLFQTTDAEGNSVQLHYDAANRLQTRTVDPMDPVTNPNGLNIVTQYEYDGIGRNVKVTEAYGSEDARSTQTVFDANGQVAETITDPDGLRLITRFTYDGQGRQLSVETGLSATLQGGTYVDNRSDARLTHYQYDKLGRLVKEIVDPAGTPTSGSNPLNITTEYRYDEADNLVAKIDTDGNITRFVFDAQNRVQYVVDAEGGVTYNQYDKQGQRTKTIVYVTPLSNIATLPVRITAANISLSLNAQQDQITHYVYNKDGQLRYTLSEQLQTTTPVVYVTENVYDTLGRKVRGIVYAKALAWDGNTTYTTLKTRIDALGSVHDQSSRLVYDKLGRLRYQIDAGGYVTQNDYYANGKLHISTKYAAAVNVGTLPGMSDMASALTAHIDDPKNQSETSVYDAAGRLSSLKDANGNTEHYGYDKAGNKTWFTNKLGYAEEPKYTWTYQYDKANRLTHEVTPEVGVNRLYTYGNSDGSEEPVDYTVTAADVTAGDWSTIALSLYGRADLGDELRAAMGDPILNTGDVLTGLPKVLAQETPENITTYITYSNSGDVLSRTEAWGAPEARTTEFRYDKAGRQTQTVFPQRSVYDADADKAQNYQNADRSVFETTKTKTSEQSGIDAQGNPIYTGPISTTIYDARGNAIANRDVAGYYSYKLYDQIGRLVYEIDAGRYVTAYQYHAVPPVNATASPAMPRP